MSINIDKLAKDMTKIVGREHVFTDRATIGVYAQDPMPYDMEEHNIPYAVVRPSSGKEISRILKYANEHLVPVHIHGAGTSLVGLARPKTNCILLDMRRMSKVEVFPERGYFEVEPGARVWEVRKILSQYNAILPTFPGSEQMATIGGIISVNTTAHVVDASLGKPGDYVLGLEVILPTGEPIETGTASMRKPAGIELTKLFVGSEGLLGVLTKIRMRLVPLPFIKNIVAYYKDVDDILDTVMAMYRERIPPPLFFEFLDERAAKVGFEAVGFEDPQAPVAMISVYSWTKAGVDEKAKSFLEFLKVGNPIKARIVEDKEEWQNIWASRAEFGNSLYRLGLTFGSEISPRIDKLKDAYHEIESLLSDLDNYKGTEFYSFGHIGAPTIHASAFIPTKDIPSEVKRALVLEVREKSESLNVKYEGCGGEWGITAQRVESFLKKKYGEVYYELLVKLKKAVDPNNILDRGNLEGWL